MGRNCPGIGGKPIISAKNLCIREGDPERNFGLLLLFVKIV